MLKSYAQKEASNWVKFIPYILFAYREVPNCQPCFLRLNYYTACLLGDHCEPEVSPWLQTGYCEPDDVNWKLFGSWKPEVENLKLWAGCCKPEVDL